MAERAETTRRRLADRLRDDPATPSALAAEFDLTPSTILDHLEHVAHTVASDPADEQLLVAPPRCRSCGFEGFDDLLNRPSRCPDCRSESIAEPTVTID